METEVFLSSVSGRLKSIASRYASDHLEAEDIYQDMVVGLLEQAHKDPSFPKQTKSYICAKAGFLAMHAVRAKNIYRRYVESVSAKPQEADQVHIDSFTSQSINPEKAVEQAEEAFRILDAIKRLSARDQAIVKMAYVGLSNAEIANKLGVSRAAITQRRAAIQGIARRVAL